MLQKHDLKSVIPDNGERLGQPEPSMLPAWFLALGTFAIGTEGFMIAPLLPTIAADLGMSLSATAMLVVVFTLVLALSSPIATVITGGLRRRNTLLLAMTIFTVGNLIAAFAPGFGTLMVARVLMAVAAGLYAPNANALAGMIVPTEKQGRALAIVSGGMTIAIALGLPLGSIIGHAFGWRSTFLMVAAMGAIAIIGILTGVGRNAGAYMSIASITERVGVIRQVPVLNLLSVTLFWSMGAYTAYPYIAPYLSLTLGFADMGIAATVTLWGIFAALGVFTGGVLNDRFGSLKVASFSLVALALSFAALAAATILPGMAAVSLTLLGVAGWGFSVWSFFPAQMARLIVAGGQGQASVALSLNTSTMYLGFSIGSAIGAGIIAVGNVWMIGAAAAMMELVALALDKIWKRNGN
ncbi:MFS transporter [Ochrobactrum soli]|uniref:Major facilitator superfamily MFS_1 n=1 Tax=Ochrobactrum soli TaxID=2448455 RepID=A0A2P9HE17_9HYPH|nr:MFS transporter [[Ochrobactrum] soli]SPL62315.1 major facilitator superfamily MFS_1 [[Ochrobactrum] soli]